MNKKHIVTPTFLELLASRQETVTEERKAQLSGLASVISKNIGENGQAVVKFICTHNSRRSQAAEFLLDVLAREQDIPIRALSGGTMHTAFYPSMIDALSNFGFEIVKFGQEENPLYIYQIGSLDLYYYSKTYDDNLVEFDNQIIVTVCQSANENCPVIPGTYERFHIGYEDPKYSDNTSEEAQVYKDKVVEIGAEIYYLTSLLSSSSN